MAKYHRPCTATVILDLLPKKGSPCFLGESVCHLECDSSILWHDAPPTAGASPMQDWSVRLQGRCYGAGWLCQGRAQPGCLSLGICHWGLNWLLEIEKPSLLICGKIWQRKTTDTCEYSCQGSGQICWWLCCWLAAVSSLTSSFFQWLPSERNFRDEKPIMTPRFWGFVIWGLINSVQSDEYLKGIWHLT